MYKFQIKVSTICQNINKVSDTFRWLALYHIQSYFTFMRFLHIFNNILASFATKFCMYYTEVSLHIRCDPCLPIVVTGLAISSDESGNLTLVSLLRGERKKQRCPC